MKKKNSAKFHFTLISCLSTIQLNMITQLETRQKFRFHFHIKLVCSFWLFGDGTKEKQDCTYFHFFTIMCVCVCVCFVLMFFQSFSNNKKCKKLFKVNSGSIGNDRKYITRLLAANNTLSIEIVTFMFVFVSRIHNNKRMAM